MTSETAGGLSTDGIPDLLTQAEAVRLLRLDRLGVRDPKETLRHLRRTRQLGFVRVAGRILIPRRAIVAYLARQTTEAIN